MGTCSCESWRWAEDEKFIDDVVEAYEKSYPNLKIHNPDYPEPAYLKSKIRWENVTFDGDFPKDTPGSDLIKSLILDDKPGPLFITAWGEQSTISRALKSIQDKYENTMEWPSIKQKISKKVILFPSGDQDDTYAKYIKPFWPDIEYRQFQNSPNYGYGTQINAQTENAQYLTLKWMKKNVSDQGALGEIFRVCGDGKQMVKGSKVDYFGFSGYTNEELNKMGYMVSMSVQEEGSWLGEEDNHTFMNMLGNGLRAYEDATYGGWGGHSIGKDISKAVTFLLREMPMPLLHNLETSITLRKPHIPISFHKPNVIFSRSFAVVRDFKI
ncbi:nucleoside hydrolase-like domain-containing protein [Flagellimonas amoyensis]|uniref:nucleoside hydrolase-like domain-containing protein n=1 Tax=Flagellimonas amoyensis TaxID=2169401 RepID=UPI0018FFFA44|nr:nucleoside hydrolase-like domain-containing protein [Allomuricauda amoyensis]